MNLNGTLQQIATDFGFDVKELIDYANEDDQTGWDAGEGAWPVGSIWQVDGQILYALIRATKPKRVLELGTLYGCSATHILLALAANNNDATLTAIDNGIHISSGIAGEMIPARLRHMLTLHRMTITEWMAIHERGFGFVFEDAMHDSASVRAIWELRDTLVNPNGFLISHDAKHYLVGSQVMAGITAAGATAKTYETFPSDCGMAIWQRGFEIDYNRTPYNALWAMTGPDERDMRKWIRESTGKNSKPGKLRLVELMEAWDALQRE